MPHKIISLIAITALTISPFVCFAEQAIRDQPVQLQADQVIVDDRKKTSTFVGTVQLTQGELRILGDKIVVAQDKQGFQQITIYGKTASFRQKRAEQNGYVEGFGERIEYDTNTEKLHLHTRARIKRNQDEIRGEHITYSVKTGIFQANNDTSGTANTAPKRVQAVLFPRSKNKTDTNIQTE